MVTEGKGSLQATKGEMEAADLSGAGDVETLPAHLRYRARAATRLRHPAPRPARSPAPELTVLFRTGCDLLMPYLMRGCGPPRFG
jgi:hypothetical protein